MRVTITLLITLVLVAVVVTGGTAATTETVRENTPQAVAVSVAAEQIGWGVFSGGGGSVSSPVYSIAGTIGQAAIGSVSSAEYTITFGFWQDFAPGSCCTNRADANGSGDVNVSDLTYIVQWLYQRGNAAPCTEHADVDGSGEVNISDLAYLASFLFQGGGAPAPC